MFVEEIRRRAETAPRAALSAVVAALWGAFAEGKITEAEAEMLSGLIEARREERPNPKPSGTVGSPRRAVGSRPRTDASLERRRRWAASGRLPPGIAARFTAAEQAVLAFVATEVVRRGDCRLAIDHVAAVAGVSRSTVKAAVREAARLGLLTVEERRLTGFRNDTNVIRIVSPEWAAWIRLARRSAFPGGGVKSPPCTNTKVLESGKTITSTGSKGRSAFPNPSGRTTSRAADVRSRH